MSGAGLESVARPADVDEVAQVLGRAAREGVRVLPVGSGRHVQAPVLGEGYTLLQTEALSGVHIYEPADLTLTAGSGTSVRALLDALAPHDQWLPFDPPDVEGRTLGGLVASGLSGPLATGYGGLRNHVLGATVVTGDGRALALGGRVVKNVAGFDLLRPVVGSRGTLCVITSVSIRLFPIPPVDRVLVFRAPRVDGIVPAARAVACAPILPASAVLASGADSGGGASLLVRLHGAKPTVDADQATLEGVVGRGADEVLEGAGAMGASTAVRDLLEGGSTDGGGATAGSARAGVGRAAALPDRLGDVLASIGSVFDESRIVADVHTGRVRFALEPEAVEGLATLRHALEGIGGTLGFDRIPDGADSEEIERARSRPRTGEVALADRVRAVFDPAGVFWSPERRA